MAVSSPDLNSPDIDLRMSRVSIKKMEIKYLLHQFYTFSFS